MVTDTAVGGVSYSYDDNGNLTDDGTYEYYYDCENRLIDVNESGNSVATYAYDYAGRRISKIIDGNTTKYCYDGAQVIAEYDGSDVIQRRFYYGPGIDEPICMQKYGDGAGLYYYHYDGLGSVIALCNSNSDIVERYSYDIFGQPTIYDANGTVITQSAYGNPYVFTARRLDPETSLYYYRARYYNPEIGRFLQTDPIRYRAGLNLYAYCGNNPINWIDPWGLSVAKAVGTASDMSTIGSTGEAALKATVTVLPYKVVIDSLAKDPDFIMSDNYAALKGISQTTCDDQYTKDKKKKDEENDEKEEKKGS